MPKVLFNGSIPGFHGRLGTLIFRLFSDGTRDLPYRAGTTFGNALNEEQRSL